MNIESLDSTDPASRIARLERSLRRTQLALATCIGAAVLTISAGMAAPAQDKPSTRVEDVIYTRKLVVLDDKDVARVTIGQDPVDSGRRSRSAGVHIYDKHGHERGGMGTFDDDSVTFALDAPHGVGDPMRDRIGMMVAADGGSQLILIDNETRGVAKLVSYGDGRGGLQLFQWEDDKILSKTLSYGGEELQTFPREKR